MSHDLVTCLWFDGRAEEAAAHYADVFPDCRVTGTTPGPDGSVLTVEFKLAGTPFVALNGGPQYSFTPAVSFQRFVDTQEELDRLWGRLTDGGQEGRCGWLVDRFGVSWQIVPRILSELFGRDTDTAARVTAAFMPMGKLDIATLVRAAE